MFSPDGFFDRVFVHDINTRTVRINTSISKYVYFTKLTQIILKKVIGQNRW